MNVTPLDDYMCVRHIQKPEVILNGDLFQAEIVSMGPEVNVPSEYQEKAGNFRELKVGEKVIVDSYDPVGVTIENNDYRFIGRGDIKAILG